MEADLLAQILEELREIRKDLHWFREREEQQQQAVREMAEDTARRLTDNTGTTVQLTNERRARAASAAFVVRAKEEK
jgi:hypothetical protein